MNPVMGTVFFVMAAVFALAAVFFFPLFLYFVLSVMAAFFIFLYGMEGQAGFEGFHFLMDSGSGLFGPVHAGRRIGGEEGSGEEDGTGGAEKKCYGDFIHDLVLLFKERNGIVGKNGIT